MEEWKIAMFQEIGWIREVNVKEEKERTLDEESRRRCARYNQATFHYQWVSDQVMK